jgi:hypothetical protein
MSEEIEITFEKIDQALEERLSARGYRVSKREHHPQVFGNRFTVYTGPKGQVRFTWDGKQQSFILRVYRKRNPVMNVLKSLLGSLDLDKLQQEVILKGHQTRMYTEEELIAKFAGDLKV